MCLRVVNCVVTGVDVFVGRIVSCVVLVLVNLYLVGKERNLRKEGYVELILIGILLGGIT